MRPLYNLPNSLTHFYSSMKNKIFTILTVTICAVLGTIQSAHAQDPLTYWDYVNVYSSNYYSKYLQQEKDSTGKLHTIFWESETNKLLYTTSVDDGTTWATPVVVDKRDWSGVNVQMVLDSHNNPHLAYERNGENAMSIIEHAYLSNGTWVKETVARDDQDANIYDQNSMHHPTLFFDGDGVLHIVYKPDSVATTLADAQWRNGTWTNTLIQTNEGTCTSLISVQGIDSVYNPKTGKAYVGFRCTGVGSGQGLYIATYANGAWSVNSPTVDEYSGEGMVLSMHVEPNGTVGIFHNDQTIEYTAYYTYLPSGSSTWRTDVLGTEKSFGWSDVNTDASGNVWAVFSSGGSMYYHTRTSAGWSARQQVDFADPNFQPGVNELSVEFTKQNLPILTYVGSRVVFTSQFAVEESVDDTGTVEEDSVDEEQENTDAITQSLVVTHVRMKGKYLKWKAVEGAKKYKIVVYYNGEKIGATKTKKTKIKIPSVWRKKYDHPVYARVKAMGENGEYGKFSKKVRLRK